MIQLTRCGLVFSGGAEDLKNLRMDFDQQHCVRLPQILGPDMLQLVQAQIDRGAFLERVYHASGTPTPVALSLKGDPAYALLHFLVNDVRLFQIVQQISGCGPIGCLRGEVYRMVPGYGHLDSWHNDLSDNRMLTMAINLSTEIYCGGLLQIRETESGRIVYEVANTGFGDGILFRIGPHLEHRVTSVEGTAARTAFAGWFLPEPDYRSWYKKELAEPG